MTNRSFEDGFTELTGNEPFPWQRTLYQRMIAGTLPSNCEIPTGLGKTSVIAVWLLARAAGAPMPRRLVYVVNRRTVVDQTTVEVERLRERLAHAGITEALAVSTLRGQMADNRAWSEDPSRPAVICGTVDMIGSRLLFSAYGVGFRGKPLHAGFLGQDALLVHDEAHLEPAFQTLLESIVAEQKRAGDPWPLRVMALTATTRTQGPRAAGEEPTLRLGEDDRGHPVVARRIGATKKLSLHVHGDRELVERIVAQVLSYTSTGAAILVFLRTVEDVTKAVVQLRKAGLQTRQLTGTMRGYERDRLVSSDPVFRRFLPGTDVASSATGTVVLVSTSAGEVGVNLSADHLVCDLSTFDAMAQRFGRVNRFGLRTDSEVHVFHPPPASLAATKQQMREVEGEPENAPDLDSLDGRRLKTLELLRCLQGDASPGALGSLDPASRHAAFAPAPRIRPTTEILFDAWAMTTIREALPGRPPVSAYLHGVAKWEPPTTRVAWRDEVDLLATADLLERYAPQDLLEDYPLKPHELLTDQATRIAETLAEAAKTYPAARDSSVWLIREGGSVDVTTLGELLKGDAKSREDALASCTLLLSAKQSRPLGGLLSAHGWSPHDAPKADDSDVDLAALGSAARSADVADAWLADDGKPRRVRLFDGQARPPGMRWIRTIVLRDEEGRGEGGEERRPLPLRWSWYERPLGADDEGSRSAARPVLLDVHSADVERFARQIVELLPLAPGIKRAVILAAKHHDDGKNRRVWQRSIGNNDRARLLAKSGGSMRPRDLTPYRHELGSVVDAERGILTELEPDERDLALHLIAAHHGRARPHFPEGELFDPEARGVDIRAEGLRVMERFARLQRRFGRWGLAYLESLVRAADYAASANPSQEEEVTR